ncbi:MAG: hypothetical protein JWN03_4241 [Nocardia sp.]|uniref:YdeI/OmpD-associated family protein n=1 Tax=Nocardia sp. TaxID=1821 RepID=UPI00261F8490|nr:YdeI/OmpD-associated family protein [Nocardia sp.]MCU1643966.1 hypothetical protein [Nocardia sp.]
MHPSGLIEVAAAEADGRWHAAYAPQSDAEIPADLAAALAANPHAGTRFEALDRTARYLVILPLLKARTPAVRKARLQKAISAL